MYRAVLEVLEEGVTVTEVARRYGVTRQAVHECLSRYANGGLDGLADRSSRSASRRTRCRRRLRRIAGLGPVADLLGAGAGRGGAAAGPVAVWRSAPERRHKDEQVTPDTQASASRD